MIEVSYQKTDTAAMFAALVTVVALGWGLYLLAYMSEAWSRKRTHQDRDIPYAPTR